MIARLNGYHFGHTFACFSNSGSITERILGSNLVCLQVEGSKATLLPFETCFELNEGQAASLSQHENFDVFEIDETGKVFKCFDNRSDDNAIVVTGRCNSACVMCPDSDRARSKAGVRSIGELLELVRYLPSDARHLTVTGGEPFLIGRNSFVLLKELKEKFTNTEFLLLTNGRIFSVPEYSVELKETMPARTTVGIPIHGFDERSHDSVTRAEGSFRQTIDGLIRLIGLEVPVELRVVVSKITSGYMDLIAELITSRLAGVKCVKIMGLEMLGNAAQNSDMVWLPYAEAFEKSRGAIVELMKNGIDVGLYNFPLCSVDRGFWHLCEKSISDYKVRYLSECGKCRVRDACGGIFAGMSRLAEPALRTVGGCLDD